MTFTVDHAVVNALTRVDEAAARFAALGFTLTPRGHHSLGSINHLMVFDDDYLELVGVEPGAARVRREIAEGPQGLNGLVFKSGDVRRLHEALRAEGIPVLAPIDFDRPVEVDGVLAHAAFRTVRVDPDWIAGGRVYFCEHKTPQLVWRRAWQAHANGATALAGLTVVVADPGTEGRRYQQLLGCSPVSTANGETAFDFGSFRLTLCTADRYRGRHGVFGCSDGIVSSARGQGSAAPKRAAYMGALAIRVAALERLRTCLADPTARTVQWRDDGTRITIAANSMFDCTLEFVE